MTLAKGPTITVTRKQVDRWFVDEPNMRMLAICEEVAHSTGLTVADLRGPSFSKEVSRARQYAYWRSYELGFSLSSIGRFFNRDHSTVRYGIIRVSENAAEHESRRTGQ